MIEQVVYNLISTDATLLTLLGGTSSDTKIYPVRASQGKAYPYIDYAVSGYGDIEEYLHTERITFKIVAKAYSTSRGIRDRLRVLLDMEYGHTKKTFTSTSYRIEYSRLVGGQDMEDDVISEDSEESVKIIVQIYDFKFLDK
jgi:hypothetical protein